MQDVVPVGAHDRSGQGLFFLLVALSIGGYTSAIAISAAAAHCGAAAGCGVAVADPPRSSPRWARSSPGRSTASSRPTTLAIWALAWLYFAGITLIGLGLHPIFKRWTTPLLTMLFVMLNFTPPAGVFQSALMPRFFSALHGLLERRGLAARRPRPARTSTGPTWGGRS